MKHFYFSALLLSTLLAGCSGDAQEQSAATSPADAVATTEVEVVEEAGTEIKPPDPETIHQAMIDVYESAQAVRVTGTAESDMKMQGMSVQMEVPFAMTLGRPDRFLGTWEPTGAMAMMGKGTAWTNDEGSFLLTGGPSGMYVRSESNEMLLGMAAGVSQAAFMNIPDMFYGMPLQVDPAELYHAGTETIEDVECHHLVGKNMMGADVELWIATESHHLMKHWQNLKMDPEKLADAQNMMGDLPGGDDPANAEINAEMEAAAKEAMAQIANMEGHMQQTYHTVEINPELGDSPFTPENLPDREPAASIQDALRNMRGPAPAGGL